MTGRRTGIMVVILVVLAATYALFLFDARPRQSEEPTITSTPSLSPTSTVTPNATPGFAAPGVIIIWPPANVILSVPTQVTPQSTTAPLPTPTPLSVSAAVERFEKTWTNNIVAVGRVLLSILIGLTALYLTAVFIEAIFFSPRQLVVADLTNASGNKDIDLIIPGLSQRIREELRTELEWLPKIAGWYGSQHAPGAVLVRTIPSPNNSVAADIGEFVKSMQDVGSDRFKLLAQFAGLLFKQHGTRVSTALQLVDQTSDKLGVTLQISDITTAALVTMKTFSEQEQRYTPPRDPSLSLKPCVGAPAQSGSKPSLADPDQAHLRSTRGALRDVAVGLASAGLLADAVTILKDALVIETDRVDDVSQLLAEYIVRLETQSKAATKYDLGQKLLDAGLLSQAVPVLVQPLPRRLRLRAARMWPVALGQTDGDRAQAYAMLAGIYRRLSLHDVARSLLIKALEIAPANRAIANRLALYQRREASALAEASGLLCDVDRYPAAEKYTSLALERAPNDQQAKQVLARIEQHKLVKAASKPAGALLDRYVALSGPALRWLALEIYRRELEVRRPRGMTSEDASEYDAKIANFMGAMYVASAVYPGDRFFGVFLDFARQKLETAHELWPNWFVPLENLGDCLRERDMYSEERPASGRFAEAAAYYGAALSLIWAAKPLGRASVVDELRVRAKRSCTMLLSEAPDLFSKGAGEILELEKVLVDSGEDWSKNIDLLFDLACLYAIADRYGASVAQPRRKARLYIAYLLAREGGRKHAERLYWSAIKEEPMLQCMRDGLDRLYGEMTLELIRNPSLPYLEIRPSKPQDESFEHVVGVIMEKANWR